MVAKCRIQKCRGLADRVGKAIDREGHSLLAKGPRAGYKIIDTSSLPDLIPTDQNQDDNQDGNDV